MKNIRVKLRDIIEIPNIVVGSKNAKVNDFINYMLREFLTSGLNSDIQSYLWKE